MQDGEYYSPYKLFTGIFVPEAIAQSRELSLGAKILFGRLCRYAGEDGRCFPFIKTLAASIGLKERQTQYLLAELESIKLIRRCKRRAKHGDHTSNEFEFLWHPMLEKPVAVHYPVQDSAPPPAESCTTLPQNGVLTSLESVAYNEDDLAKRSTEEKYLNINNRDDVAASGEPPRLLTEEEWPETIALVRKRFWSVDDIFMSRLIHASVQAAVSSGGDAVEVTDARLAHIVKDELKNPKIYSAGLLLTTVPLVIRNLYKSHLVSGGRK